MRAFTVVVGIALVLSLGLFAWVLLGVQPRTMAGLNVGETAPKIEATGWVNGEAPTAESLQGKVLVVDAWATWCWPCRQAAAELIETYQKFRDRDVVFIGLTAEGKESLPAIRGFLEETDIPWVNGYGATKTLIGFEVYAVPAVWIVGADGRVVWNFNTRKPIEKALEEALRAARERS